MVFADLGWTPEHAGQFAEQFGDEGWQAARVTRTSKHCYHVRSEEGEFVARVSGGFRHRFSQQADFPAVGDWVAIKPRAGTDEMKIGGLLERRTVFSRQAISGSGRGRRIEEQVLAANVDVAFLVAALDGERGFNLRRLERYLTLAHNGGVQPVLVLNKADLAEDPNAELERATSIAGGAPVYVVSAETGEGLDQLRAHLSE